MRWWLLWIERVPFIDASDQPFGDDVRPLVGCCPGPEVGIHGIVMGQLSVQAERLPRLWKLPLELPGPE